MRTMPQLLDDVDAGLRYVANLPPMSYPDPPEGAVVLWTTWDGTVLAAGPDALTARRRAMHRIIDHFVEGSNHELALLEELEGSCRDGGALVVLALDDRARAGLAQLLRGQGVPVLEMIEPACAR